MSAPYCAVHGTPLDDAADIRHLGCYWVCEECPDGCACQGSATITPGCDVHAHLCDEPAEVGGVIEPRPALRAVA